MQDMIKRQVVGELATALANGEIDIWCDRMRRELAQFGVDPSGKECAMSGFDDWVVFLAIGVHILPSATLYESRAVREHRAAKRRHVYESDSTRWAELG